MAARRRSLFIAPLLVLFCSVLGGLYGPAIAGASAASSEDDIKSSLKSFTKVLNVVEDNFADKVSPDGTRRPYWLTRPLKPSKEAYKLSK